MFAMVIEGNRAITEQKMTIIRPDGTPNKANNSLRIPFCRLSLKVRFS
jgi:hypothetical protein